MAKILFSKNIYCYCTFLLESYQDKLVSHLAKLGYIVRIGTSPKLNQTGQPSFLSLIEILVANDTTVATIFDIILNFIDNNQYLIYSIIIIDGFHIKYYGSNFPPVVEMKSFPQE